VVYGPRPKRALVTNVHLEKPIQRPKTRKLSKLLNQALCFVNFLIWIRDCGR